MQQKESVLQQALPSHTNTVKADSFDVATFKDLKESAEQLPKTEAAGQEILKTFPPLMQDIFSSLYKYSPELREPNEIKSSHRVNHSLINKAISTEQYDQLRNYTRLDPVNSALATVTIASKLMEVIKTELKEEAEMANKLCAAEAACDKAQARAQSLADIAAQAQGAQKTKYNKQAKAAAQQAAQAQQQLQQLQQQLDQALPGAQAKIRQAVRKAEQEALNNVKEASELLESWGNDPGQLQALPPEKRLELAQKLNKSEKMKKLARMIGRFRRLAVHAQKTKINHSQDEVHDIAKGNDLNRVVPSELALLRNEVTKREFQRKFTEGSLMQYQLRGTEQAGKGPIICAVDGSGSMAGEREMWSKAVTLGLLEVATMQKRAFAYIMFGARDDPMEVVIIKKGEKNIIEKVLRIAELFLSGGTEFETPLDKAVEILNESEFRKADIAFVTDGNCDVSDEWLKKFLQVKKDKEVRIHGVEIFGHAETLRKFCDRITSVEELGNDEASEIFQGV